MVENAIRPTAIGKKNFLFFGSPDSGQTSAVIYSLIETCRKLGINPADYLREILEALPTMQQSEAPNWTPARWAAALFNRRLHIRRQTLLYGLRYS
nr:transposase domain-containing protein [Pontiella sulfatireligans]